MGLFECILLMCINTNQFSAVKNQNLRKKSFEHKPYLKLQKVLNRLLNKTKKPS